jgi:pimeloyl-ACP methyl ester carboxylesterase
MRKAALLVLVLAPLALACATPVGVKRIDPKRVQRQLTSNILTTSELSQATQNILYQQDLTKRFGDDPQGAIAALHALVVNGRGGPDELFALAELSFHHADESRDRSYYLAAMAYASAFLLPPDPERRPPALDPRRRVAADLYNRGLTEGFAAADGKTVELKGGSYPLPFGTLDVTFDESKLQWGSRRLMQFVPVADLEVNGLATRYRWPGLGAPLAASTEPLDEKLGYDDFVQPWAKVPVTALLRIEKPGEHIKDGRVEGTLDLIAATGPTWVTVNQQSVPLEVESSAALAYTLAESPVWKQEIEGFLAGAGVIDEKTRLAALTPYKPGRIPVVLVHGTASSAGRWAQMLNELSNDRLLQERYQFWLFSYDTGNPILYSAMLLRESLAWAVKRLDPDGKDPALREMIVIGHSQGGLITRLAVTDSGSSFWDNLSKKPFEQAKLSEKTRDLVRRAVFVKPVPEVKRVVFISTPHHGSYVAGNPIAHWVARFITFPLDVAHAFNDVLRGDDDALAMTSNVQGATAVSNMTPGSRFIKTLSQLPIERGVPSHSIISVDGDGPLEDGDDGVVEYTSAHVDFTESELVVNSGHSCQDNPHTIGEVRRILLEHRADQEGTASSRRSSDLAKP